MIRPARLVLAAGLLAALALPAALPRPAAASTARASTARASTARASTARAATGKSGTGKSGTARARRGAGAGAGVTVAITSVNPTYARPGQKVTVQGSVSNSTSAAVSGLTVQLLSSGTWFTYRQQLQQYASGGDPDAVSPELGALATIRGTLRPGATTSWTAVLPVSEVHMTDFGVYPLAAQVTTATGVPLSTSWSFLPYWPASKSAQPARDDIAWIWPLIGAPDQGPCRGLLNDHLASSLSSGGRLAGLLQAGSSAAAKAARLTWAIDPALLASADIMAGGNPAAASAPKSASYAVGADRACRHAAYHPASTTAASWLARLRSALSGGQPAFVTPYADVDIAALVKANLEGDLRQAFAEGRSVASRILHRDFAPASSATASSGSAGQSASALITAAAWPADGLANYTMLENLAGLDGIRTMVLSTSAMPPRQPLSYSPSDVTSTPNGERGDMRVLLADSTLTSILGRVPASASPGTAFAARQLFLAETAMIAAQAPHLSRAIVVAPPQRWNPPAGLASELLSETDSAPWLSPVSAGSLAAARKVPGQAALHQPDNAGRNQLSPSLMRAAKAADRGVRLVQSLQVKPSPQLSWAISGIESSAWRGRAGAERPARAMLRRVADYVTRQERSVSIVGPDRDTLGGLSGSVPVSIDNRLSYSVKVEIRWQVRQSARGGFTVVAGTPVVVPVPPDSIVTKRLKVHAASIGSTTLNLSLVAPDGQHLGPGVTMTVQATHFGTFALVVLAAALGVFMITSAARAIRRGRTPPAPGRDGMATSSDGAGDGDAPAATRADGYEQPEAADSGVGPAESQPAGADHILTEDADEYARVPGRADRS